MNMGPSEVFMLFPFILLLVVVGLIVLFLRRGVPSMAMARRPRPRHWVTRLVCGALGGGILIAIAVGTWQEVQHCYAAGRAYTIHVPAKPAPVLPPVPKGRANEIEQARLLIHLLIVNSTSGNVQPIHAEEFEVHWPQDRNRTFRKEFEVVDLKCEFAFDLHALTVKSDFKGNSPRLVPNGNIHYRSNNAFGSSAGSMSFPQALRGNLFEIRIDGLQNQPLSIVPRQHEHGKLHAYFVVTHVAPDDPLKEISPEEFFTSAQPFQENPHNIMDDDRDDQMVLSRPKIGMPAAGIALAAHIGVASLLLLVAAVLFTQLFTRRALAFAGVLAALVLYVAVLDRIALGAHLSRFADATAPLATRLTAGTQATCTFFYRQTLMGTASTVAQDQTAPQALRDLAGKITHHAGT